MADEFAERYLRDGDLVQMDSRRGGLVLPARASDTVAPTQAHVAMHWGDEVLGGHAADGSASAGINGLTNPAFCPRSKQPELKHTAVRLQRAQLPWQLLAVAWLPDSHGVAARREMQGLMAQFDFATCVPFSSTTTAPCRYSGSTARPRSIMFS